MTEITFLIEDDPESGYCARADGQSIFTEAESMEALKDAIREAVCCHFPDESNRPKLIHTLVL